jgi:long-subunit acyl-CoA synthetase (AMP-forming)
MKPEHITGGPSVFNLLLELMRNFPELKDNLGSFMKTVISSGAPNNSQTAKAIESAFGLTMHNAFGMTETQQILSTLLFDKSSPEHLKSLGPPLPGVTIGLKRLTDQNGFYRLYVNSPFGYKRIMGEDSNNGGPGNFFNTGDIVSLDEGNRIIYRGRENRDFIKDGFGVKIPLDCMRRYYERLYAQAEHVEYFPIKSNPGMAAMIFIRNSSVQQGKVAENRVIRHYARLINEMNARLYKKLEPFEFRHRFISRFVLINSVVPKTVKGNVS